MISQLGCCWTSNPYHIHSRLDFHHGRDHETPFVNLLVAQKASSLAGPGSEHHTAADTEALEAVREASAAAPEASKAVDSLGAVEAADAVACSLEVAVVAGVACSWEVAALGIVDTVEAADNLEVVEQEAKVPAILWEAAVEEPDIHRDQEVVVVLGNLGRVAALVEVVGMHC
jgi:hypothetical protein